MINAQLPSSSSSQLLNGFFVSVVTLFKNKTPHPKPALFQFYKFEMVCTATKGAGINVTASQVREEPFLSICISNCVLHAASE